MIKLSPSQRQMVGVIQREFAAAGLGSLAPAAIVNAYAESRLNPRAIGDHGNSVGLFQLNSNGGAGTGMSVAARQDPVINTRKIIEVIKKSGKAAIAAAQRGDTDGAIAAFVRYVERPGDIPGEIKARQAYARELFPQLAQTARPEEPHTLFPLAVAAAVVLIPMASIFIPAGMTAAIPAAVASRGAGLLRLISTP